MALGRALLSGPGRAGPTEGWRTSLICIAAGDSPQYSRLSPNPPFYLYAETVTHRDLAPGDSARRPRTRYHRPRPRRADQCHVAGDRGPVELCTGLPLLQQLHRSESARLGCPPCHARRAAGRWTRFCSDQQMGGLRSPLCRHRWARASGRAGAGGAVWIFAGYAVGAGRCCPRRLRAGFCDPAVFGPPRRQIPHRDGPRGSGPGGRRGRLSGHPQHHRDSTCGLRVGGGQCLEGQSVGSLYHRHDHPHRPADGRLSAPSAAGQSAGDFAARFHPGACWRFGAASWFPRVHP